MRTPSDAGSPTSAELLKLARGYPPVLGAMLLVDGVITLILGGDAAVSLGEVVAYLLLPPLAMFLVTQTTGGRRPNAVTLGVGVAGAAVLLAALFLLGGVHLVTLPPWVLVLVGLVFLGVAVVLLRQGAAAAEADEVPPLLSRSEREGFAEPGGHDPGDGSDDDSTHESGYGSAHGSGLPPVPGHSAGPPEPEWPPRRDPIGAPWSAETRPAPTADWSDSDSQAPAGAQPAWSDNDPGNAAGARPNWPSGPAEREWPPAAGAEWPPRRDPDPAAPQAEQRSWFEPDNAQPAESSRPAGPADGPPEGEWPPPERTYPSGRRSRHPDR